MPKVGNYIGRFDSAAPDFIKWDQESVLGQECPWPHG